MERHVEIIIEVHTQWQWIMYFIHEEVVTWMVWWADSTNIHLLEGIWAAQQAWTGGGKATNILWRPLHKWMVGVHITAWKYGIRGTMVVTWSTKSGPYAGWHGIKQTSGADVSGHEDGKLHTRLRPQG